MKKAFIRIAQVLLALIGLHGAYGLALRAGFSITYGAVAISMQELLGSIGIAAVCGLCIYGLQHYYEGKHVLPPMSAKKAVTMSTVAIAIAVLIALTIVAWIAVAAFSSL